MKKILTLFSLCGILLGSCSDPKPQKINFGHEECDHCRMTIMEPHFAAELVTKTGKALKYDSAECMLSHMVAQPELKEKAALLLVSDYNAQTFTDATKATFLISENLPSPMGANLSAYPNKADAEFMREQKEGQLFSWEEIFDYFVKTQD